MAYQGNQAANRARVLNPNAKVFHPAIDVIDAHKCLYLTFSNGSPLTETEIWEFFEGMFGQDCVVKIYLQRENGDLSFGKIMFNGTHIPRLVLGKMKETRYTVNGHPMWCKPFDGASSSTTFENTGPRRNF